MTHWRKVPTYDEVLGHLETDYKVKLPQRVALHLYASFVYNKFQENQLAIGGHSAAADEQRDHAMTQAAATEDGVARQELLQFAQTRGQQSDTANQEARRYLQDSAQNHQRGMREQAA